MSADQTVTLHEEEPEKPPEARPGVLILFTAGVVAGRVKSIGRRSSVGRTPEHRICLADAGVSRHHATFLCERGDLRLVDEGSRNGCFVNGQRVEGGQRITFGDVARCGSTLMLCVRDAEAYADWPQGACLPPLLGGPEIRRVAQLAELVAQQDVEVMIQGESGTGKEVVARMIHRASGRSGPFVGVNCAAIPEALFEAELFGVVKGAYTGAETDRPGLISAAAGGTLFLDEVGELPLALQAKLLRALELRESRPLGGTRALSLDLRLIAATNRGLGAAVQRGAFRLDLFHRLCGFTINLPALRQRREDIVVLAEHVLDSAVEDRGERLALTCPLVERLLLHDWPGNVRELQRTLQEARLRARVDECRELQLAHLRPELLESRAASQEPEELQRVRAALTRCGGNVKQAASELELRRQRIYDLLREHGLKPADFR